MKDQPLPAYRPVVAALARWYIPRFVRKAFHAVRLDAQSDIPPAATPTVIYLNHPSWWDPLIGAVIACRFYPRHKHYCPIDAQSLAQYPIMRQLGFFPVHKNSARGAAEFLQASRSVLRQNNAILWVTPQGDFVDSLVRPVALKPGLGHLARDIYPVTFVPMAVEYIFWQDRLPEALISLGAPISPDMHGEKTPAQWTQRLAEALEHQQNVLRAKAISRSGAGFTTLLAQRSGVGGIYDARMRLSGKRHVAETTERSEEAET
ncbi:MAG: lysophospholipid acyltransferase family protein [Phycisphaerae bacterium]